MANSTKPAWRSQFGRFGALLREEEFLLSLLAVAIGAAVGYCVFGLLWLIGQI